MKEEFFKLRPSSRERLAILAESALDNEVSVEEHCFLCTTAEDLARDELGEGAEAEFVFARKYLITFKGCRDVLSWGQN